MLTSPQVSAWWSEVLQLSIFAIQRDPYASGGSAVKQTITSPSNDTSDGSVIKREENARKSMERYRQSGAKKWSGLQVRMTISYLGMTVVIVLLSELLIALVIVARLTETAALDKVALTTTRHTAQVYALEAGVQASGTTLDARTTFQPGRPASIALP